MDRPREPLLAITALAAGIGLAWFDTRPGWDDTAVTVVSLVVGAAVAASLSGRRPWLWALLVGLPIPIAEVPGGQLAGIVALVFAAVGALTGWLASRAFVAHDPI